MTGTPTARATLPVTIVAGFLGAGKTTLLNRVLRDENSARIGVLVNDFADINIDADLVSQASPGRIALTNGCVCCTLRDDLLASALELARTDPALDYILIECSGLSDPRAIAQSLTGELAHGIFAIDTMISLVDAANVLDMSYEATERVIDQAAASDLVVLNKCDLVDEATLARIEALLCEAQPAMRIIATSHADIPSDLIAASRTAGIAPRRYEPPGQSHAHTTAYATQSWQSSRALSLPAFEAAIANVPKAVYRAKGILYFAEHHRHRAVFHLVGKRAELTFENTAETSQDTGPISRLVAIGKADFEPIEAIDRLFKAAASQQNSTARSAVEVA